MPKKHYSPRISRFLVSVLYHEAKRRQIPMTRLTDELLRQQLIGSPAWQMVEQLKRTQDALGEWHDWLTLVETVQKHVRSEARSPLLAELNNITRAKFREAIAVVQETRSETSTKPVLITQAKGGGRRKPVASQEQAAVAIA